jgi:adenylate kinase family enzyme
MKIILIGAPGSGKTTIAEFFSNEKDMIHIECDAIFWSGKDLRTEVSKLIQNEHWILDGHISKVSDIVLPLADKFVVIEGLRMRNLWRAIKRDVKNFKKCWFNIQNYEKMSVKREELIQELLKNRKEDVFFLNNFPDLNKSELTALGEKLKSSTMKSRQESI